MNSTLESKPALLLTCEHGGNRVPEPYRSLFENQAAVLATHRGYDIGALSAARFLARSLSRPLIAATTTRLLVDLNRSPGHPRQFSEFTRALPPAERTRIAERHYQPYREQVQGWVQSRVVRGRPVVHISVHSFTEHLNGRQRHCDIGLLYDPSRPLERAFCADWQQNLRLASADFVVRRNYPYRGVSDGLVTWLRRAFGPMDYAGIELELNQALAIAGGKRWRQLLRLLSDQLPV